MQEAIELLPLPPVGRPDEYYGTKIHEADRIGDVNGHEALKVAHYISLALSPGLAWAEKQRYFEHAIHRHCTPPLDSSDDVLVLFDQLKELVKKHAGEEAIRIASIADDKFAARLTQGEALPGVRADAALFFRSVLGDARRTPDFLSFDDWHQLVVLKNAWVGGA